MASNVDFELQQWEVGGNSTDLERDLILRVRDGWQLVSFQTHLRPDGELIAVALFRK